ncbi:isoprenyl transferase [Sphingomicrobium sp. XHP0239]|uniref:isoprenyl transferase n=1 Tax=Sphingomicrobium maritimum TaxID=3133972 RepID=UPI0031CCB17F
MSEALASSSETSAETRANVPRHVAIIMDGNGRWAKAKGLPRVAGHREGAEAVRRTLRAAVEYGVECLTLYAFSSENWRRSEEEVTDLKGLMRFYLDRELEELAREGVRLRFIGEPSAFGPDLWNRLQRASEKTAGNERLTLNVALNYGSRQEIAAAARRLAEQVASGDRTVDSIDCDAMENAMQTAGLPDLDLVIRTSGEQRLSNFLLWQAAYAEFIFLDQLWPDFDAAALGEAIAVYQKRQRRFGGR